MTTTTIREDLTTDDVALIAEIRKIAAEQPDYVYRGRAEVPHCLYGPDEQNPNGCLIGYALRRLGHSADLATQDAFSLLRGHMRSELGLDISEHVASWTCAVQSQQDQGKPWGEAVRLTDAQPRYADLRNVGRVEDGAA